MSAVVDINLSTLASDWPHIAARIFSCGRKKWASLAAGLHHLFYPTPESRRLLSPSI